ncbi:MAG: efflux RND transporter periplasmic adaptor subunit [Saezia sp.]
MAKKNKSWVRWIIVACIVPLALWFGKNYFFKAPDAPQLITAAVKRGDIEDTVLASGTFEALKQVSVGAQVSGRVLTLHVDLNDQVKEGELVAEIDSVTQQNRLKNVESALSVIQAKLEAERASLAKAKLEYDRQVKLRRSDASSKSEFEAADAQYKSVQANMKALQAQLNQAKIDVDTARVDLGYTKITSPMDGTVVAIVTKEGQTVNANQSAPTIIKVADLSTMTVKAEISEADVTRVKAGQQVYFTILGEPNKRFDAVLRAIEPAPESIVNESVSSSSASSNAAVYYNGLFDVTNPDGKFRISMTAEVNIVRDAAKDVLLIPSSALQRDPNTKTYFVRVKTASGGVEQRDVTVGINNRVSVQILEGLKESEEVVLGDSSLNAPASGGLRMGGGISGRPR